MDREMARIRSKLPVFKKRIEEADAIVKKALGMMKKPYVSCSFGKDSVVLLHLVLRHSAEIDVIFINSQYCFPDTYEVRDTFKEKHNINMIELKQPHDYIDIINQYGLPDERTSYEQKKVVELLKKDLANAFAYEHGYDGNFWGMRKDESRKRKWLLNTKGPIFWAEQAKLWRISPLTNWTWDDIWTYIHFYEVPYSKIYDKHGFCDPKQIRNTSYVTTDGATINGRVAWLRYYYPDIYNRLSQTIPEIRRYV